MNKAIGLALLVGGIVLLGYGINSKNSFASSVNQAFTGSPTDKTVWLLATGGAASIAGAVLVFKSSSRS